VFRSTGLFEQIGSKRRRRDIRQMFMLGNCSDLIGIEAAHSNAVLKQNRVMSSTMSF
jgi:hypothetical protein